MFSEILKQKEKWISVNIIQGNQWDKWGTSKVKWRSYSILSAEVFALDLMCKKSDGESTDT